MNFKYQKDAWTFLLITAVAVLIWYWAAGETQVERDLLVHVQFTVAEPEGWLIEPGAQTFTVTAEGSQRAVRDAAESIKNLELLVSPDPGVTTMNVAEELSAHPTVRETGISIVSVEPRTIELSADRLVTATAQVVVNLPPGVEAEELAPTQVQLTIPEQARRLLPREIQVEAAIDRDQVSILQPGMSHTLENVRLRLPAQFPGREAITIEPPVASVTITIRSQIEEHLLDLVRINLAGPPGDDEYVVNLEPMTLRNVTISASSDLIAKIRSGEATVVALLHLKSTEKDGRLGQKPVTCFVALLPDAPAEPVEFRMVGDSTAWPIITLTITDRPEG